jgi:hypothetical protein
MVEQHDTIFGGVSRTGITDAPTILQRTDEDFIGGLLNELAGENGISVATDASRKKLAQERDRNRVLRLYQPVHRAFHIALLEIACDYQGQYPRLDPEKIDSAGLVVRRVVYKGGREVAQGWMSAGRTIRGWVDFETNAQADQDPDAEIRPLALTTGNAEIDRRLMLSYKAPLAGRPSVSQFSEAVETLFIAPPDVSAATRKTILYGMVPVTSTEKSEAPPPAAAFDKNDETLRQHVSGYLRSGVNTPFSSLAGKSFGYAQVSTPRPEPKSELGQFMLLLQQLTVEFNVFSGKPEAARLFNELNQLQLSFTAQGRINKRGAGDFLKEAKAVLVDGDGAGNATTVRMPDSWPTASAAQATKLWDAIRPAMSARFEDIRPQEGRFDNLASTYRLRAFVRVKRDDGCPPKLVWSKPSEPFRIIPWYETGPMPPVQVILPSLNRDFLRNVKPNVSFAVPSDLANLLQGNDPKKMSDGEGKKADGLQLDWICGFNIPIITICAFIVLNIFLSLFDLIFQWMFYIKICIPIPKKE